MGAHTATKLVVAEGGKFTPHVNPDVRLLEEGRPQSIKTYLLKDPEDREPVDKEDAQKIAEQVRLGTPVSFPNSLAAIETTESSGGGALVVAVACLGVAREL